MRLKTENEREVGIVGYRRYQDGPSPGFLPDICRSTGASRLPAVLCVFDNPVFLDRICKNLELHRDISVDSSISVEDAHHLMRYVLYDAIVTDFTVGQSKTHGFLKTVRYQGNPVPFIYFTRARDILNDREARECGDVFTVEWEETPLFRGFDDLYRSVKRAIATNRGLSNSQNRGFL